MCCSSFINSRSAAHAHMVWSLSLFPSFLFFSLPSPSLSLSLSLPPAEEITKQQRQQHPDSISEISQEVELCGNDFWHVGRDHYRDGRKNSGSGLESDIAWELAIVWGNFQSKADPDPIASSRAFVYCIYRQH
jgi:hypothetical protein